MPKGQGTWLGGLLEGEGCFSWSRNHGCYIPRIHVGMVDKDIMERVASKLGTKVNGPYDKGHQPVYVAIAQGTKALATMLTVFPEMGIRRRRRIEHILTAWEHGLPMGESRA